MAAWRCPQCSEKWPTEIKGSTNPDDHFKICPECCVATYWSHGATPISDAAAISRKRHADFERYCKQRDKRLAKEAKALEAIPVIEEKP